MSKVSPEPIELGISHLHPDLPHFFFELLGLKLLRFLGDKVNSSESGVVNDVATLSFPTGF